MFSKLSLIEGLLLIVHMRILTETTKDGIPQHFFWSEPLLLWYSRYDEIVLCIVKYGQNVICHEPSDNYLSTWFTFARV
jgi:hypothetical protein